MLLVDSKIGATFWTTQVRNANELFDQLPGGETFDFMDAIDIVHTLRNAMKRLLRETFKTYAYTDSKPLFNGKEPGRCTTEKRLSVNIAGARNAYKRFELVRIGLIPVDISLQPLSQKWG